MPKNKSNKSKRATHRVLFDLEAWPAGCVEPGQPPTLLYAFVNKETKEVGEVQCLTVNSTKANND